MKFLILLMGVIMAIPAQAAEKTAVFAGGCFWCIEAELEALPGVSQVVSGYTGGEAADAQYDKVSTKKTAHREAVEVTYDPGVIDYARLLTAFWENIDPTDEGGQFFDRGAHYTTAIYVADAQERALAEASKAEVEARLKQNVATAIVDKVPFYAAEEHHQDYYKKNPMHYNAYKKGSGREKTLEKVWGQTKE